METISPQDPVFNTVIEQYNKVVSDFTSSLIRKNLTEEFKTKGDYVGREIYELIQNAEDQKSQYVKITLDENFISVENGGPDCVPFSREGFISIMMADMSPKFEDGSKQYIGCKGLGFRSILNWAKSIEIRSNGVSCKFSREIADACWDGIKQYIIQNVGDANKAEQVIKEHESFAQKHYGFRTPVPTLAKPETNSYFGEQNSTVICVEYDRNDSRVVDSINEQINSISGAILIFLANINEIEILDNVHGTTQKLTSIQKPIEDDIRLYTITSPRQAPISYYVLKESGEILDKKYEIGIAYCPEMKEPRHYLYSFFPTKKYIGLPCYVHATFDLNSSRNALKENSPENERLMGILAEALMRFSSWIAKSRAAGNIYNWDAVSVLSLNEFDRQDYPILAKCIEEKLPKLPIIPTVGRQYISLKETEYYGYEFSSFFDDLSSELPVCTKLFGKHINPDIPASLSVCQSTDFDDFKSRIDELSEAMLTIGECERKMRIRLIAALMNLDCECKFRVLVERDVHQLCEGTAYIYVGRSLPDPPEELKITYIDQDLLSEIYGLLGSQDPETIRKKLVKITDIRRSDVNTLKNQIISFTEQNNDVEKFKELIRSFFKGIYKVNENDNISKVVEEIADQLLLFDSTGKGKHYPYEMVLKEASNSQLDGYPQEWILYLSLEEWAQYLETSIDTAKDFFIHILGVSSTVPMDYVSFGEDGRYLSLYSTQYPTKESPFPYCFRSDYILNYQANRKMANYGYVVKPEFLDYLAGKGPTCNEFLSRIFSDPICRDAVNNRYIYYQYRSLHSEIASCSYLEYKLREHRALDPIRTYVLSDNINLLSDAKESFNNLPGLSEHETKQILLNLGAKSTLAELSKDELYSILYKIPDKCPARGVSDIYKKIREALLNYRDDCVQDAQDFRAKGKVFARRDGKVGIWPTSEVYYWDNDQLPQKVLSTKPKLEIGNRIGEESVKSLFGVSLAKEITIEEVSTKSVINVALTTQINDYFKQRIKYILSYVFDKQAKFREDYVEPIKDVRFNIYSTYHYLMDGTEYALNDGEMVTRPKRDKVYNICSYVGGIINDSIEDPKLCEALVESICITLKITGSDKVGYFRNILSSSISRNEFTWKRDGVYANWGDIEIAMGMSEKEKQHWALIAEQTNKSIDTSRLTLGYREKISYLSEVYPNIDFSELFEKSFPEFDEMNLDKKYLFAILLKRHYGFQDVSIFEEHGLFDYYVKRLNEIKNTYGKAYEYKRYQTLLEKEDRTVEDVYGWFYGCQQFSDYQSWVEELAKENCNKLLDDEQLEALVAEYLCNNCGINDRNAVEDLVPRSEYTDIMTEADLIESDFQQEDLALRYFESFGDVFREKATAIAQQRKADSQAANSEDEETVVGVLSYGVGVSIDIGKDTEHSRAGGGSYNSRPANLYRNGKKAEMLVYETLRANQNIYPKVIKNSRILDPVSGGDNNGKHCDIIYYKKDKPAEERYLEVKSLKGSSIYLSDDEYIFAMAHQNTYDLAVVKDNNVTIIEHPFRDEENAPMLKARPDVYRIDLAVNKIDS